MGLNPNIWPDHIICGNVGPVLYTLFVNYTAYNNRVYYEVKDDYSVQFNAATGAYLTAGGMPAGVCLNKSIQTLCAEGRCIW